MKKLSLLIMVSLIALSGCSTLQKNADKHTNEQEFSVIHSEGPLQIMASFYPLAHFVEQVGGDRVQVTNMTPVGGEPHDYEPSPREIANIQSSDLFVYLGAGFEPWAEDIEQNLQGVNSLEMSAHLKLMKNEEPNEHEEDADEEEHEDEHHHHGEYDPHVWLDPLLVEEQVVEIQETLKTIDPDHASDYNQRAAAFLNELQQLDADFKAAFTNCKLQSALVSHDAFSYFGKRYGIDFHAISGLSPQAEPSAKHLAELSDLARSEGIQHIFFETLISPKLAQTIADEVGAETLVLNPLEGLTSDQVSAGDTYVSIMRENMQNLKKALQCQ